MVVKTMATRNRRTPALAAVALMSVALLSACSTDSDSNGESSSAAASESVESSPESSAAESAEATAGASEEASEEQSDSEQAGAEGGQVEVTADPADNLTDGDKINVKASGLDPEKGYYGAICAKDSASRKPVPDCTGQRGDAGAQQWLANKPGATTPVGQDGAVTFELVATSKGQGVDCSKQECVVKIFGDHTEGFEHVAEIPVSFAN